MNLAILRKDMGILTEQDKKDLINDAKSIKRREDYRKLNKSKNSTLSLELLEEITDLLPISYPRFFIKADKNLL